MSMPALTTRWGTHGFCDNSLEQQSGGVFSQDDGSVSTYDDQHTKDEPQEYVCESTEENEETESFERERSQVLPTKSQMICLSTTPTDDDQHTKDEPQEYVCDSTEEDEETQSFERERSQVLPTKSQMLCLSTTPTAPKSKAYVPREPMLATNPGRASRFPSEWQDWQHGCNDMAVTSAWYDRMPFGPSGMVQHSNVNTYFQQQRPAHTPPPSSLSGILAQISNVDSRYIVAVRKLHRLGRFAHKRLRSYFSRYGVVVDVLISYSSTYAGNGVVRRSSSIGFVLMQDPVKAALIIAQKVHEISGTQILVEAFVRRSRDPM